MEQEISVYASLQTQLYSVWSENERIRQQIHELESKILQYRYEEELDKAVDEQVKRNPGPLVAKLSLPTAAI